MAHATVVGDNTATTARAAGTPARAGAVLYNLMNTTDSLGEMIPKKNYNKKFVTH